MNHPGAELLQISARTADLRRRHTLKRLIVATLSTAACGLSVNAAAANFRSKKRRSRASRARSSPARRRARGRRGVHRSRQGLQRRLHGARHRGRRARSARQGLRSRRASRWVSRRRRSKRSTIFPDLDQYKGLPLDYGRMEPTVSDPSVMQQQGMRVGMPDAGQMNALETLNIRGERSVTCKGKFDAHPSTGPLPAGRARGLRGIPQAARRARARRGARCAVRPQSRSCTLADVLRRRGLQGSVRHQGHAHDVEQRRRTSRWTCRRSTRRSSRSCARRARSSTRSRSRTSSTAAPAIRAARRRSATNWVTGGQTSSAWSGQACNPYDTERVSRGSSGGSGAAIGGNLATIGICEQSGASCQGPASRNGIALILTTKGIMPDSGGIGNQWFNDRAGIHARTLGDAAQGARRGQGSEDRLLRSARSVHGHPEAL